MDLERIVANLVQKVERRFYGKYRGFVADNADPKHLGRLRVRVPSLLGADVVTGWAMPCVAFGGASDQGVLFIPEVDSGVWVEFEEGDLEFPIWVGTFWSEPGGESEVPKPNDPDGAEQGSVQDPITRKIIKTVKGHTIQFEDADGDESIIVVQVNEDGNNVVVLNADGITLTDLYGNTVVLASDGITATDLTGNAIAMTDSAFTITAKKAFTIDASGQAVQITADTIDFAKG
jgi:uncharacterized protein involved in type VI secretion and phage assembly